MTNICNSSNTQKASAISVQYACHNELYYFWNVRIVSLSNPPQEILSIKANMVFVCVDKNWAVLGIFF
jgi:hypothetical protein